MRNPKLNSFMYKTLNIHSFTTNANLKKKKEIGSLRKNGHLFLSIFKNLEDKFLFFMKKTGLNQNALKTVFKFFV